MLAARKMMRRRGGRALEFVGGKSIEVIASTNPSFSLTGLSGGLASAPEAGDLVVIAVAFRNNSDTDIVCTSTGWVETHDLYVNGTNDVNLGLYYKFLTAADTSIAFTVASFTNSSVAMHVWRGAEPSNPVKASVAGATGANANPAPPAIATDVPGSVVISVGAMAGDSTNTLGDLSAPGGMEKFFGRSRSNSDNIGLASYLKEDVGIVPPGSFGHSASPSSAMTWAAATIAIRPT